MHIKVIWAIARYLITAATLFVIWLLFTSSFTMFSVIAGLIGSLGLSFLTYNVFIPEHDASRNSFLPRPLQLIFFFVVLVYNLYLSSFKMLISIIKNDPNPRIVHFRTHLSSDLGRMVLANSITLTPGTITLDLNDDHLTVHWFFCNTSHSKLAGELVKGDFENILEKVWT